MATICDCESFETCPSCAADEPTYAKAASHLAAVRAGGAYKGPINLPCSACSAGD